ncbi:hypothetical protein MJT46_005062 [Ovis ammon polii x Ovis aries]|nr:hypothetical protein MJT46_005062 [Ovis ammon polii x Ovis aries]
MESLDLAFDGASESFVGVPGEGYHAKAPPQLQGQDLRTAQTFGEQKEAGSLINHQFFRTAFLDFPNAPTSEFLLVFLHPLSRVHAEGLECVKLNSMICRLVFHSGVQHDRGPCESSKTIPQRYKLQGSPAEVPAPYLQRNGGKFHIHSARSHVLGRLWVDFTEFLKLEVECIYVVTQFSARKSTALMKFSERSMNKTVSRSSDVASGSYRSGILIQQPLTQLHPGFTKVDEILLVREKDKETGANSVILASLDDESSPLQSFGEGLPPPEQDIRLFRYLAPVFMWLVASAMVLSPEDLLSAEVVRPSQPLFLLLPLHGVLFCMTVDILLTSKPKLSPPTTKPSQIPQDQSRREVSLNLSQVARGLRGNMRICGWRLTSRAGSEQKRSLPESQPGCTWPEGKHEDLWLEARQPSQLGEKSRKANEKAVP